MDDAEQSVIGLPADPSEHASLRLEAVKVIFQALANGAWTEAGTDSAVRGIARFLIEGR